LGSLEQTPIGVDLVEYNPTRDLNGMTAMVAAKLLKELIVLMSG
jgi:arginase